MNGTGNPTHSPTKEPAATTETKHPFANVGFSSGTHVTSWDVIAKSMANINIDRRIQNTQLAFQPSDGGRSGMHSSNRAANSVGSGVTTHTRMTRVRDVVLQ
ncbi:hypothetical protein ON010_g12225 [Phytophthora cinnamomi]|nr:hypothetical protein ON010_g12225 [Phytophthora cinnamomi]